jgi:hypothetical protein
LPELPKSPELEIENNLTGEALRRGHGNLCGIAGGRVFIKKGKIKGSPTLSALL